MLENGYMIRLALKVRLAAAKVWGCCDANQTDRQRLTNVKVI